MKERLILFGKFMYSAFIIFAGMLLIGLSFMLDEFVTWQYIVYGISFIAYIFLNIVASPMLVINERTS